MELPFVEKDVDYKGMYMKMVRASEAAINILIEAQKECEEMYLEATEPILDAILAEEERLGDEGTQTDTPSA